MTGFDRETLIHGLSDFSDAVPGIPSASVRAYLSYYGLLDIAEMARYKIGRLMLDGVAVTVQGFSQPSERQAKGTVLVVHGYMDHMGLYQHLILQLFQGHYDVLCYDLSGHGLSDGTPLLVDDFQHYATQLAELLLILEHELVHPLHLVGQSTGAAVVLAQRLLCGDECRPLCGERVLLAPLVRPAQWKIILRKYRWLKYLLRCVPRSPSRNSHDKQFIRFINKQDPLQHRKIPVRWIGAMLSWGDWIEKHPPVAGRIHMIQGSDDGTVAWQHNMAELKRLFPNLELQLVEGAKHHLVNETPEYRDQVFHYLLRALEAGKNANGPP